MFADRRIVITVRGALDTSTAPDLERLTGDNLTARPDVLVLDLTGVERLDAAAIEALLRIQAAVAAESVLLTVLPSEAARAAIEVAGESDQLGVAAA
jgi:anti-sigma B factor antagonist